MLLRYGPSSKLGCVGHKEYLIMTWHPKISDARLETYLSHALVLSWVFHTQMIQHLIELQCGWSLLGVVL